MLKIIKTLLIAAIALWGLIAAMHNVIDWQGTLGAVKAATTMSSFDGGSDSWQATDNRVIIWGGALFILLGKVAGGAICALAAVRMWRNRAAEASAFDEAKKLSLVGCGIFLFMLCGGFIIIAETWFELWRSDSMRGPVLGSALRYAGMIAFVALFVGATDD